MNKELIKKWFPHIAAELERDPDVIFSSFRSTEEEAEKASREPTVVDFIRRCDTPEQALEIIEFMEKEGEITPEYAEKLRRQLTEKGLRSFGPKKEPGYYFKYGI